MKRLLPLVLSCFLLFESRAQDALENKQDGKVSELSKAYGENGNAAAFTDSLIVLPNLSLLKEKKPGVYRLPQDNMPCIVPDSTKSVKIPNGWKGPLRVPYRSHPPRIPNLSKPPQKS